MSQNRLYPFRGTFFASSRVQPERVVAPPYDIIKEEEHRRLLARSPYNIVRWTLGETPGRKGDFQRSWQALQELLQKGILSVDQTPRLYAYGVQFERDSRPAAFLGLAGALDLRTCCVFPHEKTVTAVESERMEALAGTRANLGLVLLVLRDGGTLRRLLETHRSRLRVQVEVSEREQHAVWDLDQKAWGELAEQCGSADLVIADGHHRFQTAKRYAELNPDDPAAQRCLVVVGSLGEGSGLQILPTHRVLAFASAVQAAQWVISLQRAFEKASAGQEDLRVLWAENPDGIPLRLDPARCEFPNLMSYLHARCLAGVPEGTQVVPTHDLSGSMEKIRRGEPVVAVQVRAVRPEELFKTVKRGEVFPPKSTFFYPKLYSGLIMRLVEHDQVFS